MTDNPSVEVTQADEQAAAALLDRIGGIQRFEKFGVSFAQMNNAFCAAFARHRIAHDTSRAVAQEAWQPIETAPVDEMILGALQVVNNKTGQEWWEMHAICIDSETGEVRDETDAGWSAGDYTHWQPLPDPPAQAIRSLPPVEGGE